MSSLEIVLGIVMLVGLVGVIVPVLPGLLLVLGAGVLWAFERGGTGAWMVVGAMTVIGVGGLVTSNVLPARRARSRGTAGWVVAAGVVGLVVGFFVVPVVGALIGFPAGVFVAEMVRNRHPGPAWRATRDAVKSVGLGIAIQLVAGTAMIGIWLTAVLTA